MDARQLSQIIARKPPVGIRFLCIFKKVGRVDWAKAHELDI
jgi:hypothetical protein